MANGQGEQVERALAAGEARRGFAAVVPNPKLKLMDQIWEVIRLGAVVWQRVAAVGGVTAAGAGPGF
jgi:alcohol dehydrogenase YqhD (iron-dependent ADH family)